MARSLRTRIKHLSYKGLISKRDSDRIRDALAKQIPQKCEDVITSDDEYIGSKCKCGYFIGFAMNYCPNCGQEILW